MRGAHGRGRVRRRRRHHGVGGRRSAGAPRPDARARRVAHGRSRGVAAGGRARRQRLVPRIGRQLRVRGEVPRAGRARGAGGHRERARGPWPRAHAGCSARTSASPSPAWPGPTSRRAWRPGTVVVGPGPARARAESLVFHLPGDRERVRQYAAISALDLLRRRILAAEVPSGAEQGHGSRSRPSGRRPRGARARRSVSVAATVVDRHTSRPARAGSRRRRWRWPGTPPSAAPSSSATSSAAPVARGQHLGLAARPPPHTGPTVWMIHRADRANPGVALASPGSHPPSCRARGTQLGGAPRRGGWPRRRHHPRRADGWPRSRRRRCPAR